MTSWHLRRAVWHLRHGDIVAYPTEAVWGLGCNPADIDAVARLLALKRRPAGKGLILIADHIDRLAAFMAPLTPTTRQQLLDSWPGPVTWVVPAAPNVPRLLTGGRGTLAVRVSAHPVAAALASAFGGALISTSANLTGRPPADSAIRLRRQLGSTLDYILPGGLGGASRPTEIRDALSGDVIRRG